MDNANAGLVLVDVIVPSVKIFLGETQLKTRARVRGPKVSQFKSFRDISTFFFLSFFMAQ